jgi:hypothetical protein
MEPDSIWFLVGGAAPTGAPLTVMGSIGNLVVCSREKFALAVGE